MLSVLVIASIAAGTRKELCDADGEIVDAIKRESPGVHIPDGVEKQFYEVGKENAKMIQLASLSPTERAKKITIGIFGFAVGFAGGAAMGAGGVALGSFVLAKIGIGVAAGSAAGPAGMLLGSILGSFVGVAAYLWHQRNQHGYDLDRILEEVEHDGQCAPLLHKYMQSYFNTEPIKDDSSKYISLFMRASVLNGVPHSEDSILEKSIPTNTVAAVAHAIYHSPAVPIHESISIYMAYLHSHGASAATIHAWSLALASPAIPLMGFPIAFVINKMAEYYVPYMFSKSKELLKQPNLTNEYFQYRGRVYAPYKLVSNYDAEMKEDRARLRRASAAAPKTCRYRKSARGNVFTKKIQSLMEQFPDRFEERIKEALRQEYTDREVQACFDLIKEREKFGIRKKLFQLAVPPPTYMDEWFLDEHNGSSVWEIARQQEDMVKTLSGGDQVLKNLSQALLQMADLDEEGNEINFEGHLTEGSWNYERLQNIFDLPFPVLPNRSSDENVRSEVRLREAIYLWILVKKGNVGKPVDKATFNGHTLRSYFWGAPKVANTYRGSDVLHEQQRCEISGEQAIPKELKIKVTLDCWDVGGAKPTRSNRTVDIPARVVPWKDSFTHHGTHHGLAFGAMGGVAGFLLFGHLALPIAAGVVAGAIVAPLVGVTAMASKDNYLQKMEVTDENILSGIKYADSNTFYHPMASLAWDCQFKPLKNAIQSLIKLYNNSVGEFKSLAVLAPSQRAY
eukprot:TRINITY_DN9664_c0_g1_i2.p1 TRINITY_DN9664_c0_g1~~TRINITY_DN9664_c0_g1_i2.p1  ORF type:complete len:736 (+),score=44.66 TRINITY_DN9664_c0_g1_i2:70-2277(+)